MRWTNRSTARVLKPAGFIEPCIPIVSKKIPDGEEWLHEIKHDGYRMMLRRSVDRVRLFTRGGYNWTKRYPRIAAALEKLDCTSVILDGEAVWCGADGIPNFENLHSRGYDDEVCYFAFDLLELDGVDYRSLPLQDRKAELAKLIRRNPALRYVEHFDQDGHVMFEHVCKLGLEGIVSKRRDLPYRSGRSKTWLKIKNPKSPANLRLVEEAF